MPIYVYRCETCGAECEEIQKVDDPAPKRASECSQKNAKCNLVKTMTTAGHRFKMEMSNDGIGGYQRQGDVLIRQVTGKNSSRYGSDSSGRD